MEISKTKQLAFVPRFYFISYNFTRNNKKISMDLCGQTSAWLDEIWIGFKIFQAYDPLDLDNRFKSPGTNFLFNTPNFHSGIPTDILEFYKVFSSFFFRESLVLHGYTIPDPYSSSPLKSANTLISQDTFFNQRATAMGLILKSQCCSSKTQG